MGTDHLPLERRALLARGVQAKKSDAGRRDSGFMDDADSQSAMDSLVTDNHWREVLNILTDVGSSGRYHDLDTMLDGQLASQSPLDRWCALEVSGASPR